MVKGNHFEAAREKQVRMDKNRVKEEMMRRASAWGAAGVGASMEGATQSTAPSGGGGNSLVISSSHSLDRPGSVGGSGSGTMEGPLPAEVRSIIHASCSGDAAEQAEIYARRLLSTHRRVRVYREELGAAVEETEDITGVIKKNTLICDALKQEIGGIDAKIQMLLNERQLCQVQLETEARSLQRNESKREEAERRVDVLRTTIDNITRETQRGHMLLRQLVPNLQIENYCT